MQISTSTKDMPHRVVLANNPGNGSVAVVMMLADSPSFESALNLAANLTLDQAEGLGNQLIQIAQGVRQAIERNQNAIQKANQPEAPADPVPAKDAAPATPPSAPSAPPAPAAGDKPAPAKGAEGDKGKPN